MKTQNADQQYMPIITTIVKIGSMKLSFEVPQFWSVNKFKCLLASQIPSLNFDQFQICCKGKLQRGTYKISDIFKMEKKLQMEMKMDGEARQFSRKIQVEVVKVKSQMKLNQYYKYTFQNFLKLSDHSKQPVLCPSFQRCKNLINYEQKKNENNQNRNQQNFNINDFNQDLNQVQVGNNAANPAHQLMRALRFLGTYLLIVLVYDHGKAHQIAIILAVIGLYFLVQFLIKYKQKKLQNNRGNRNNIQNIEQQPANIPNPNTNELPTNQQTQQKQKIKKQKKGLLKLYFFKISEIIFCFILTFFPNLTIDIHLQINKQRIEQARTEINQYIPNSFPKVDNQHVQNNRNLN